MSVGAGFYPARRFANAPLVPVRRGRCPHRPAAPANAESPRLPLRGRCHGEAVTEGLSHSGGAEPRPYNRLPHLRLAFALSFRASDRCHWRGNPHPPALASPFGRGGRAQRGRRGQTEKGRLPAALLSVSINLSCHSEEHPKGTCFAARSDVGIRIFSDRNLRKAQNLCVLETDCHASPRAGSQ